MMRRIAIAFVVAVFVPGLAFAQTTKELLDGASDSGNVVNYGMGYDLKRFSTLDQINKQTVKNLVPVWAYGLESGQSQESQPLVYKGVIYITTENATMAVDAKTGRQIWKTRLNYAPATYRMTCCGNINRGVALFDGKVYRTTLDNRVIAYNAKDGKEVWSAKTTDIVNGYSMTVAPLVADGVVIVGNSGAEYGTRGFIDGYDAKTGKQLWRTQTVACPGEPGGDSWPKGDACKRGGG
jgi:alcohol dehydrogenase (cytochrome c)